MKIKKFTDDERIPCLVTAPFKSKGRLEAENTALRHQLIVLRSDCQGELIYRVLVEPIGRLIMAKKRKAKAKAKKSKNAKLAALARKKKGMRKAKPAKKKKRAPKPTLARLAPSPLVPASPTFGGKTEDQ
jgi:hypothetical protein